MITELLGSEHFAISMLRSAPAVTSAAEAPGERPRDPQGGGATT
jgi:hypothetical protein